MSGAGVGISSATDPREAAEEAAAQAHAGLARVDGALVFATSGYGDGLPKLLDAVGDALGTSVLVGSTVHGVLANSQEHEGGSAVAVLALSGFELEAFVLADLSGEEEAAAEEIAARLGGAPRPEDLVVLFPDPRALRPDALLSALHARLAPATLVGAGAADPVAGSPRQWCGARIEAEALAGLVVRARKPPRIGVTQACRPASELLTVTRTQGNWILELDGRPALDVFREVARGPLAEDLRRAAAYVLIAYPLEEGVPLRPGGYLVRHVAGFAPEERAFASPEPVSPGDRIALAQREPESAREDLKEMLAGLAGSDPVLGLYLNCCARGEAFFRVAGLESAYLESVFQGVPIAGMFGSCEIGPIAGRTELLTYTGVLALVDA